MKVLTTCLLLSFLLGCTATSAQVDETDPDFESYSVELQANLAENRLDILTPAAGWGKAGKKNGWVGFARGKFGTVTFSMKEESAHTTCTIDPDTSADWVLTKIELTKNGHPPTQKGHDFGTRQKGWIERAFPQMDPSDGSVLDVDKSKASISFVLDDLNNDRNPRYPYYQITATRCSDGLSLMTDPGLGNGGRK